MMGRLESGQEKDLVKRIRLKQKEIREKDFAHNLQYDLSKDDSDILDMFGIQKKKKVQKGRGGFWGH